MLCMSPPPPPSSRHHFFFCTKGDLVWHLVRFLSCGLRFIQVLGVTIHPDLTGTQPRKCDQEPLAQRFAGGGPGASLAVLVAQVLCWKAQSEIRMSPHLYVTRPFGNLEREGTRLVDHSLPKGPPVRFHAKRQLPHCGSVTIYSGLWFGEGLVGVGVGGGSANT